MRRVLSAVLVTAALALAPAGADARSEKVVGWTAARVFPTAVRFLRVDEGVTIVEKDAEAGYVLFELSDEGKTFPGSLELATFERDGGAQAARPARAGAAPPAEARAGAGRARASARRAGA